jgi:hypothetical protein
MYMYIYMIQHPDKSKGEGAEEAIKILNNALEVLLSQLVFQSHDIPIVSRYESKNTFKKKEKTAEEKAEKTKKTDESCSSDRCKNVKANGNKKTSKTDFVKEFLEEEKKFLAENLKKKVYHESRMKMKIIRKVYTSKYNICIYIGMLTNYDVCFILYTLLLFGYI